MSVTRIWWDCESRYDDPTEIGWLHEGDVFLPFYMEDLELGARASTYLQLQEG